LDYSNFETVLVDNGSQDGSFEAAKANFSKSTFIKNTQNLGFSAGVNVGIRYALERGADYILLLNYDVAVKKDFLSILVEEMEKNEKVGLASPVILGGADSQIWFSGGKIDWLKMKTFHEKENLSQNNFNSDYITGCAMLIRSAVFKKTGLLDEDYFLYWEDADFSVKAKKAGYQLLVSPASRVFHFEKSEEKKENKTYWLVLSGLLFFKKNCPLWLRPWIFVYVLARRLKNRRDVRLDKNGLVLAVQKAYRDYEKYSK
jgi:hypothetical protein